MLQIGSFIAKLFLDKSTPFKPAAVHAFLSGLVVVIMLMFMVATLLSALTLAALFFIYNALLSSAIEPGMAFVIMTIITIAIFITLVTLARHKIKQLQEFAKSEQPLEFRLSAIVSSFLDGFFNQPDERKEL